MASQSRLKSTDELRATVPDLLEPNIYGFEIKKLQELRKTRYHNTLFGKDVRSKLLQGTIGGGSGLPNDSDQQ